MPVGHICFATVFGFRNVAKANKIKSGGIGERCEVIPVERVVDQRTGIRCTNLVLVEITPSRTDLSHSLGHRAAELQDGDLAVEVPCRVSE